MALGKALFQGMMVTARNFIGSYFEKDRLVTVQYPEEKIQVPENSRTFPFLVFDDTPENMRCVACKICETDCPPQCIYIVMDRDENGKPRQRPKVFDIDISVCMQCQICVEVCPFEAIKMDNDYEKSQYDRFDDLVEHLPDLLKSNDYYHQIKSIEATAVDSKLKASAEKKGKKPPATPPKSPPKPEAKPPPAKSSTPSPSKIVIPEDAPFTPEQRAWLSGFLSSANAGATPVGSTPAQEASSPQIPLQEVDEVAPADTVASSTAEAPDGGWPWHDPGLEMSQRMDIAKNASFADKLMAAMAQTDCHACGYDCRGYADAIADGSESDLSLCLPGESETENMLTELMKEAGKL